METTFDKFITNDAKQKALFDKEYIEFLRSEKALKKLEKGHPKEPAAAKTKFIRRKHSAV